MPGATSTISFMTGIVLLMALMTYQSQAKETESDALPITGSNLNNFSYPNHHCKSKPSKPGKPSALTANIDVDAYNLAIAQYNIQVARYNKNIKIYKSCINTYIKNGNHDLDIIKKKLNAALKEARESN